MVQVQHICIHGLPSQVSWAQLPQDQLIITGCLQVCFNTLYKFEFNVEVIVFNTPF